MSNKNNFFSIANNLENLEDNKGYLIWIRCGAFFVAICANAVILSNILGLKRICIKHGVCKVGISKRLYYLNLIDAELGTQRVMLRIMQKNKWMDEKKFRVSMEMLYEIGKILGGLIKQYAKNNKK